MAKEFDYLAAARAASGKPKKDSPGLDPTASWYAGDARYLFANIIDSCGYPIAKHIFQKCINEGAELEGKKEKRVATAQRRATAPPIELPTIEEIDAAAATADRHQISVWWARLSDTDQDFNADEKLVIHHLAGRYVEVGGYRKDFNPHLPPRKKEGSVKRDAPNSELPAMFDETNPESAFSIWNAKRNGRGGKEQFAELLASRSDKKYGPTAEAVRRNERNWRKKKRKV